MYGGVAPKLYHAILQELVGVQCLLANVVMTCLQSAAVALRYGFNIAASRQQLKSISKIDWLSLLYSPIPVKKGPGQFTLAWLLSEVYDTRMARTKSSQRPAACFGDVLDGKVNVAIDDHQERWFGVFMPALRAFHQRFGNTDIPEDFIVPHSSSSWPQRTWGLHLGQIVSRSSETKRVYKAQVQRSQQELLQLGFTWTATNAADRAWKHQVLPALKTFRQGFGHCNVMRDFVVPDHDPWPTNTWGLNIGAIVKRIRTERSYAVQAERDDEILAKLDFTWHPLDVEWQERLLPALVTFADEFGEDDSVTPDFVVPAEMPWPKQTWGLALGSFLCDSKCREKYFAQIGRDAHLLDELGFEVELSDAIWECHVVPLLTVFSVVFPHRQALPKDFIVPRQRPWPRKMWGLRLGLIGAQNAGRLAAVQLTWKQKGTSALATPSDCRKYWWKSKILPALVTFVKVFGDCRIGEHFKVPSEDPWPKPTWGLQLGAVIRDYQKKGAYFAQLGRDADCLKVLGFSFKLSDAVWEQCMAPVISTFSAIYPCKLITDDFVIPADSSWKEALWGVKLGEIVRWNSHHMTAVEREWRVAVLKAVEVFQQVNGNIAIGEKFVVPAQSSWPSKTWGMDLAQILHRLHTGERYGGHVALAQSSKLELSLRKHRDDTWNKIFWSLKEFATEYGHCCVEPDFVVPSKSPWSVQRLRLGEIIEEMGRSGAFFEYVGRHATLLMEVGFVLHLSTTPWEEKIAPLIATFAGLHPQDIIPTNFSIPSDEHWPENAWGVQLGRIMEWNSKRVKIIECDWKAQVLQATDVFEYEYGNKVVQSDFVVPSHSPWPEKTWGKELMSIIASVYEGQHYGGHVAIVESYNASVHVGSNQHVEQWTVVILPALHMFATIFGHCTVTDDFVVPAQPPWPKQTWRLKLGDIIAAMKNRGDHFVDAGREADRLEKIGFRYQLADSPWKQYISPLLAKFEAQFGHEIIPEDFVVPARQVWPEEFRGLRLGKLLSWSSRFSWQYEGAKWKERKMVDNGSLTNGLCHCRIPANYAVPCRFPWPKVIWGVKLGSILLQLRQSGDLFIPDAPDGAFKSGHTFGFVFKLDVEQLPVRRLEPEDGQSATDSELADSYKWDELQGRKLQRKRQRDELEESPELSPAQSLVDQEQGMSSFIRPTSGKMVGIYSPRARRKRVERFLVKRQQRVWRREIKYDVRKSFADARLRVKGRFVSREDEKLLRELLSFT